MSGSALLTPEFVFDLESRMRMLTENEYAAFAANSQWQRFAGFSTIQSKKERISWLLSTAMIEYVNRLGGEVTFDSIVAQTTEWEYKAATAGLRLNRYQLLDHDGNGVEAAGQWSRDMGEYAGYWPQKQIMKAVRDGEAAGSVSYDGVPFFSGSHPLNPFASENGTYANLFTGGASGAFPGALKIDESVSVDVAVKNVGLALAYIRSIKMPNGEDPRGLRGVAIMHPPALENRVQQITGAKFIAQAATAGGGSGDVSAIISNWKFEAPICVDELGAGFPNGDDTSWYIVAKQGGTASELAPVVYVERETFNIVYHDGMSSSELLKANGLEWVLRGANNVHYGHPYQMFKAKAA